MPFTPFHFGPAILLGLLLLKYVDFPTFVAANVLVDWRAFLVFFGFWKGPLHSWQHSYLGAVALSIFLGAAMVYLRPYFEVLMDNYSLEQVVSGRKIFFAAFTGTFLHVTIDAFHHPNMPTFLPLDSRPLYGYMSTFEVRTVTFACLVLSLPLFLFLSRDEIGLVGASS
jgi:hypothetical protein